MMGRVQCDAISKAELFACLGSHDANLTIHHSGYVNPIVGILQSIQREDGSGHNFNLTIKQTNGKDITVFVRAY